MKWKELTDATELPINTPMWIKTEKYKGDKIAETDDGQDFYVFVSSAWMNPYSTIPRSQVTHYCLIKRPK